MTDQELLDEARETWRLSATMSGAHAALMHALEAHVRGLDAHCWDNLFDHEFLKYEARELLAKAARR